MNPPISHRSGMLTSSKADSPRIDKLWNVYNVCQTRHSTRLVAHFRALGPEEQDVLDLSRLDLGQYHLLRLWNTP